jgi:F-type H+-transporting ATPase subunit b
LISVNFTLLVQLANFLILLVILNFLLFKPVLRILDEREALVNESAELKKRLGGLADENIQEYESRLYSAKQEAMGIRATLRNESMTEYRKVLQAARDDSAVELEATRQKITDQAEVTRKALQGEVSSLAQGIFAKLVGREL